MAIAKTRSPRLRLPPWKKWFLKTSKYLKTHQPEREPADRGNPHPNEYVLILKNGQFLSKWKKVL